MQKGRMKGNAQRGHRLSFGSFGIKALEECWMTARQIEAARIAVTRYMKRQGQVWIRIFPDKPITKKPAEVRMGKGKGAPEYWAATVTPGRILFEVDGVDGKVAKEALRLAVDSHYVYNDASDKDKNVNNVVYEARQCFGFATDLFKEMLQFIKNNEKRFGDGTTK